MPWKFLLGCMAVPVVAIGGLILISLLLPSRPSSSGLTEAPKEQGRPADTPGRVARDGDIVTVRADHICAATKEVLDEVIKWSARNDREEMVRALMRGGGRIISKGSKIKVLDNGLFKAKVRLLDSDYECWTIREATE